MYGQNRDGRGEFFSRARLRNGYFPVSPLDDVPALDCSLKTTALKADLLTDYFVLRDRPGPAAGSPGIRLEQHTRAALCEMRVTAFVQPVRWRKGLSMPQTVIHQLLQRWRRRQIIAPFFGFLFGALGAPALLLGFSN